MKITNKTIVLLFVFAILVLSLPALALPRLMWQTPSAAAGMRLAPLALASLSRVVPAPLVRGWEQPLKDFVAFEALQGPDGDRLVLGSTFVLEEGETLDGSLVVMGGMATIQSGAIVDRDVVVMGGTVRVDGSIEGNVVAIGGQVDLGEAALIKGDVNILGGNLTRADGARVEGNINNAAGGPFPLVIPGRVFVPEVPVQVNPLASGAGILAKGLWVLLRSFLWALLAGLVVLFLPVHTERVARAAMRQPWIGGGLGLLTAFVAPLLLVAMAITILGIPISLVGVIVFVVAWAFGVIVLGSEVGKRLLQALKLEWALAASAALGTFVLTLVVNTIGAVVPCVGWVAPAIVGVLGLGAVMLTRFGMQEYPLEAAYAPVKPEVPAAPLPPEVDAQPAAEIPAEGEPEQ